LHEALAALRPEEAEVVRLRLDGTKYKDAAGRLGLPIGTVVSRVERAKRALRRRLQGEAPEEKQAA
jgi:RNA polymerase sigma-70 factor (ECF subfamily)